jgi:RNA polymerase sigma-70 factor (sigma-E family)
MRDQPADGEYEAFFSHVLPRVERVASRIVGPGPAAEDVAVEALARAFARWRVVKAMAYPDIWVLRVATNIALDIVRRRRVDLEVPRSTASAADEVVERNALVEALRRLPRRQQEVVVLRYIADLSETEVASILGVSCGTVKAHLHRALPRLRTQLGEAL